MYKITEYTHVVGLKLFTINDIEAEVYDFGHFQENCKEDEEDFDIKFKGFAPSDFVLSMYKIDHEEYNQIVLELTKRLQFYCWSDWE